MNKYISYVARWQQTLIREAVSYFVKRLILIEMLVIIGVVSAVLGSLPYFNIIFTHSVVLGILIVCAFVLFRPTKQIVLLFSMFLFVLALLYTLLGFVDTAEYTGNVIYFMLWYVVFLYGKEVWKNH